MWWLQGGLVIAQAYRLTRKTQYAAMAANPTTAAHDATAPISPPDQHRHGDLVHNDMGGLHVYLRQSMQRIVVSLEDGKGRRPFDPAAVYRRWRIRQAHADGSRTIGEYEGT